MALPPSYTDVVWSRMHDGFTVGLVNRVLQVAGFSVEMWRGTGLPVSTQGYTTLNINEILEHPALPRRMFDPHLELPKTVVLQKKVVKGPRFGRVHVAVVYGPTPFIEFSGGPQVWGKARSDDQFMAHEVPSFSNSPAGSGGGIVYQPFTVQRSKIIRRRPFLVTLSVQPNVIANIIERNLGRLYVIDLGEGNERPYILSGYQFIESGNQNQLILLLESYSLGTVPSFGPGTIPGAAVVIPGLDYMEEYLPPDRTTGTPVINKVFPSFEVGEPLPVGP